MTNEQKQSPRACMRRWFVLGFLGVLAVGAALAVGPRKAEASCVPSLSSEWYAWPWCQSNLVSEMWDWYDFDYSDWGVEWGFNEPCNLGRPLGRTMNALEVLNYSDKVDATTTSDFSGGMLHWAGNYSIREIDELDARCSGVAGASAYTSYGPFVDNYTELYNPFFEQPVILRAATVFHEARHADGCGHNGNDGEVRCRAGGTACDESFDSGCWEPTASGQGTRGMESLWLWWFTVDADAQHGTSTNKELAADQANSIFANSFDTKYCARVLPNGTSYTMDAASCAARVN